MTRNLKTYFGVCRLSNVTINEKSPDQTTEAELPRAYALLKLTSAAGQTGVAKFAAPNPFCESTRLALGDTPGGEAVKPELAILG